MIFTFWEGTKPAYIDLCMQTWKQPYTLLTYDNLKDYTDLPIDKLKRFTLPLIADCVRVHVLKDYGGYWLDADTIVLGDELPIENMAGNLEERTNHIGFLHTLPHSQMFEEWAKYQDQIINNHKGAVGWNLMGNAFTDGWVKSHLDVKLYPAENCCAETYMVKGDEPRYNKYQKFYFNESHTLGELKSTPMLMLHNSWTPQWYKDLSREDVLKSTCTMSNILREVLNR